MNEKKNVTKYGNKLETFCLKVFHHLLSDQGRIDENTGIIDAKIGG